MFQLRMWFPLFGDTRHDGTETRKVSLATLDVLSVVILPPLSSQAFDCLVLSPTPFSSSSITGYLLEVVHPARRGFFYRPFFLLFVTFSDQFYFHLLALLFCYIWSLSYIYLIIRLILCTLFPSCSSCTKVLSPIPY